MAPQIVHQGGTLQPTQELGGAFIPVYQKGSGRFRAWLEVESPDPVVVLAPAEIAA